MKKCPFCKKEIKPGNHVYTCAKKNNFNGTKNDIKFEYIKYNFGEILCNKENFIKKYEEQLYSIPMFNEEFGTDNKTIIFLLEYFDIEKRNISESAKKISSKKYKKTCQEKYGVDNVSQIKEVKEKKKDTFLKNYGVDNIFKDDEFKKWILENNFAWNNLTEEENKKRVEKETKSIKKFWSDPNNTERINKILKNNNKKWHNWYDNMSDEEKSKWFLNKTKFSSKLESKIADILLNLNISFETQRFVNSMSYDFILNKTKILIEVQGDFWHLNPIIYNKEDIVNFPGKGNINPEIIWKKDHNKKLNAEKYGYKVVYIWENEINENTDNDIIKLLIERIGL